MIKASRKLLLSALVLVSANTVVADDMSKWIRPAEVPYPANNKPTKERVELGKILFFDVRLSKSDKISCATCHDPNRGWSDAVPKAVGHEGKTGPRNTPAILNSAYQHHQFWDGRVRTLEQQALGPIQADVEMAMPLDELVTKLNKIEGYKPLFEKAYPSEGITKDTIAKAIASFERTIVSSDSPFDKYAKGDKNAISQEAKKGFELFKGKAKCVDCHDTFNFTDGSFHNIGLDDGDKGRYGVKARKAWYGAMKTPTLRDVTKSAPYFHDGSSKDLKDATTNCCNGGKNPHAKGKSTFMEDRGLNKQEIELIVEFIKSLESPKQDIKVPTSFPK
jgi:cytochrome c peroxidase